MTLHRKIGLKAGSGQSQDDKKLSTEEEKSVHIYPGMFFIISKFYEGNKTPATSFLIITYVFLSLCFLHKLYFLMRMHPRES